jgi:hypothetical protein
MIVPDMNDPHEAEALEYEFHRLMGIAEAYTGAEKLKQSLPGPLPEKVLKLQQWIDQERELREAHLVPYTIEDMRKRIEESTAKDDFHEERFQREGEGDKSRD